MYPIELLESVIKTPEEYRDMLWPWLNERELSSFCESKVFYHQRRSWVAFTVWQNQSRKGIAGDYRQVNSRAFKDDVRSAWRVFVEAFQLKDAGFDEYNEALRTLLAQYGFTRPFQVEEDPQRQDKATEWIEYMGYEHAMHYMHTRALKRLQPAFDEEWKTLVDSIVLQPHETQETFLGYWTPDDRIDEAHKRVKRAAQVAQVAYTNL